MEAADPSFLRSSSLHSLPSSRQRQHVSPSSLRLPSYSWGLNRSLRTDEPELVRGVLRMLQGFSSYLFQWDDESQQGFSVKDGVYVPHLSQTALCGVLDRFVFAADCLKIVEIFVKKVEASRFGSPTLRAFSACVSSWLAAFRGMVLKVEEANATGSSDGRATTLLGLGETLHICTRAEYLLQIVQGSVPSALFDSESSIIAAELAVHIIDHLFLKLNEVCLVQGGEEAYHMLVTIFIGTLLPYLEELDSWLYDGNLDDPFEELFFYSNKLISVDRPEFWEKSYLLRPGRCKNSSYKTSLFQRFHGPAIQDEKSGKPPPMRTLKGTETNDDDSVLCPLFLKGVAKAIISAGKSLQLVQHVWGDSSSIFSEDNDRKLVFSRTPLHSQSANSLNRSPGIGSGVELFDNHAPEDGELKPDDTSDLSASENKELKYCQRMRVLKLQEIFLISLVGLIGDGTHMYEYFPYAFLSPQEILVACKEFERCQELDKENGSHNHKQFWLSLLVDTIINQSRCLGINEVSINSTVGQKSCSIGVAKKSLDTIKGCTGKWLSSDNSEKNKVVQFPPLYPQNPVITVCRDFLVENVAFWDELNGSRNFPLPPLDDEILRGAIFGENFSNVNNDSARLAMNTVSCSEGTNFTLGYKSHQFGDFQLLKAIKTLETLYPFPTLLPCLQENLPVSQFISFQKNGSLATQVLNWLQREKSDVAPLPSVIIQECLIVYVCKQVDFVGGRILMKLMSDWKLMDELNVLRSIYLLGSGDLLQQFLMVIFNKVDKGDSLDDEFELNTALQESIRNSIDGTIIGAPESVTVSVMKHDISDADDHATSIVSTPHKGHKHAFGIDALDPVKFTYKVSWPLDLIINKEAIKKYNLVMNFLLKVKRAKFVLDKARRWMWKSGGSMTCTHKHHLLVEQKLLNFVDAFHQYVMDKVLHSSWLELCTGMASAGSLDEVIDVHEAYLLSIQRQCFVASDKLWILIASRVKTILGLALDFYAIQQTLINGGAASAIKARCEMEVDRIEKEFDECIAFLLRVMSFKLNVGHFPHLADLVTRINYNYFYMSDDGSFLTIPSFEPSGPKQPKTFHGKT